MTPTTWCLCSCKSFHVFFPLHVYHTDLWHHFVWLHAILMEEPPWAVHRWTYYTWGRDKLLSWLSLCGFGALFFTSKMILINIGKFTNFLLSHITLYILTTFIFIICVLSNCSFTFIFVFAKEDLCFLIWPWCHTKKDLLFSKIIKVTSFVFLKYFQWLAQCPKMAT